MNRLDCDRMFAAVMETGSFAGAAEKLRTSSGQASKLVSRLEAELGVRLLNRTTRAVSATEAGRAYHDRLRPLLDAFDDLDLSIRNISQTPTGRLRVSAPLTFGALALTPALNEFALRFPEIALDVSFSDRMVNLVDEGFDMAVRIGKPEDSSLISRRLCKARIVVIAAPDYLDRRGTPAAPEELGGHDCIIDANYRDPTHWPFLGAGGPLTVQVGGRIRYSNAEACLRAAEAGLGIARVPAFVAGEAIGAGRVALLLERYEAAPYEVHALYPHSRHLAAKVRALVDFLAKRYRDRPDWEVNW
ncbi:LysR family transcriptional regulator [Limimaricola litoreus]|uniref:LysR family transcriptional regulator n=1 Tax=Limimaricola litoreus TaxID=2955316 RepID=A0A9X2FYM7_9RHOB|nr:LysR family transcriptional regulator [Limimaricola litoreus]MCP1169533.1 LysR family transcriptional regulator [Limimaricola litoreus]